MLTGRKAQRQLELAGQEALEGKVQRQLTLTGQKQLGGKTTEVSDGDWTEGAGRENPCSGSLSLGTRRWVGEARGWVELTW